MAEGQAFDLAIGAGDRVGATHVDRCSYGELAAGERGTASGDREVPASNGDGANHCIYQTAGGEDLYLGADAGRVDLSDIHIGGVAGQGQGASGIAGAAEQEECAATRRR